MFDIKKLTLGEIDKVETLAGQSVGMLGEDDTPKGKMLAALAYVVKRRQELAEGNPPKFSWNDAMGLTMDDANVILGLGDDDDEVDEDEGEDEAEDATPNREERRAEARRTSRKRSAPKSDEEDPTQGA